jgi:hypothetical protein
MFIPRSATMVAPSFVALCFFGCSTTTPQSAVQVPGGETIKLERSGAGFKQAQNDRIAIAEAVLQAVNFDGNSYLRWTFAIRPKQATQLGSIRIEDVTNAPSLVLVNDVSPQLENGLWRENAGLMEVSSPALNWLSGPGESVRIFKFTIGEPDGQSYVLYQGAMQLPAAKQAIRRMVAG